MYNDERDTLKHFGVKGMHWGVRKSVQSAIANRKARKTAKESLKNEKKQIKQRKNELLGKVVQSEQKIHKAISSKMTTDYDAAMESSIVASKYVREYAKLGNSYIRANPKVVPKGMTMRYNPKEADGDDLSPGLDYTYNGKPVSFSYSSRLNVNDKVFLEDPQ